MQKTPSVFLRNPENMSELTQQPNPAALWVFAGEGVATRKYDGTCVMLDADGEWWARREVKKDKTPPPNWLELEFDPITEKRMGYEPIAQSGYVKAFEDALSHVLVECEAKGWVINPGTYELCGPKINKNPEGYPYHYLVSHTEAEVFEHCGEAVHDVNDPELFDKFKDFFQLTVGEFRKWEGIVWHHPDGRMAKLKVRDFNNIKEN